MNMDSETQWCADLYDQCAERHEARAREYRARAAQLRGPVLPAGTILHHKKQGKKPLMWHNPSHVSDPGRADGWRLLLKYEEYIPEDGEVWSDHLKGWTPSQARKSDRRSLKLSYRTKQPLPTTQP